MTTILPAPAKLNLFLHIVERRADGYHNLQTVFQLIDLADDLSLQVRPDRQINLHCKFNIANNLVIKAARLLQSIGDTQYGVDIHLTKRIPLGAGLGGGSSDAATTLLALNSLWNLNLSTEKLAELGLQLGADVPIFILGHSAWGEGIGERLTPVILPETWYIILQPACHIVTQQIFSDPQLTRNSPTITIQQFLDGTMPTRNDMEAVVCKRYPLVAEALNCLKQYLPARLTGSGACVFGSCLTKAQAQNIAEKIPKAFNPLVAKGLNESPLLSLLKK